MAACVDFGAALPDAALTPDAGRVDGGGAVTEIRMYGLAFKPNLVEITPGTLVKWTNLDAVPHTVTEGNPEDTGMPQFESPLMATGDRFEWTFVEQGEWVYYCRTHPNVMRGNIIRVK